MRVRMRAITVVFAHRDVCVLFDRSAWRGQGGSGAQSSNVDDLGQGYQFERSRTGVLRHVQ